jgi:UV DNA damage repair endonuclease
MTEHMDDSLDQMRLALEEEVAIILTDIFDGDDEGQASCLDQLASQQDLVLSDLSKEEKEELILENEDLLYTLYKQYTENHA